MIPINSVKQLVFVMETQYLFSYVGTEFLNVI
jgi:hypothetical protein